MLTTSTLVEPLQITTPDPCCPLKLRLQLDPRIPLVTVLTVCSGLYFLFLPGQGDHMYFQALLQVSVSYVVSRCISTTHLPLTEHMKRGTCESLLVVQKVFFKSQILQGPRAIQILVQKNNTCIITVPEQSQPLSFSRFFLNKSLCLNWNSLAYHQNKDMGRWILSYLLKLLERNLTHSPSLLSRLILCRYRPRSYDDLYKTPKP